MAKKTSAANILRSSIIVQRFLNITEKDGSFHEEKFESQVYSSVDEAAPRLRELNRGCVDSVFFTRAV